MAGVPGAIEQHWRCSILILWICTSTHISGTTSCQYQKDYGQSTTIIITTADARMGERMGIRRISYDQTDFIRSTRDLTSLNSQE
jgi:hypothetical protein